jgi:RHS repeat-associated protein
MIRKASWFGNGTNMLSEFRQGIAANDNQSCHLIAESNGSTGAVIRENVWLGGTPIAQADSSGNIYAVHVDQVHNPQKMTDATPTIVWDRVQQPFGEQVSVTGTPTQNLRFPGQYADSENSSVYNLSRDYVTGIARYIESDPLGLAGTLNTQMNLYSYAAANPLSVIDPRGLIGAGVVGTISGEGGVGSGAGVTISGGRGAFYSPDQGFSTGNFSSAGAFSSGNGAKYPGSCSQTPQAYGAFAGAGGGLFFTNAPSVNELAGDFTTYNFNLGRGPFQFSVQYGYANGTGIVSITFGPGLGVSGSGFPTTTSIAK